MLKGIPAILPPELLKVLAEMGHGDEITIADANFPGHTCCKNVIRMDGHGIPEILDAVLTLLPLDGYVTFPLTLMEVVKGDDVMTPIWDDYKAIASKHENRSGLFEEIERFAFYERVRKNSIAVVMTGERALYANIILRKGVL